jgi:threonyl-tRNA synthetase
MVRITLPDKTIREFDHVVNGREIAENISPRLAQDALAIKVDGRMLDLSAKIEHDVTIEIITTKSNPKLSLELIRHSCAHVMAQAVCRLFPQTKLVYGPTVENGFYYDIDLDRTITPEDFSAIEDQMRQIVKENLPFVRYDMPRSEAMAKLQQEGNRYKIENAQRAAGDTLSFYVTGEHKPGHFEDLCIGPHVPSTGKIGAFKLMSIAGAYFHGDAKEKMLQRLYGAAFATDKELQQYLTMLEEAKKRDHRLIGKQQDLFSFHEEGPGFAFFHPKGMIVWNEMLNFWREIHRRDGYEEIRTPIILNERLWHQSGHWDNYKQNMYFTQIDDLTYAVKPMNCPGGCLVFKSRPHSYREFPIRMAELGLVHRHEASGVLHGLLRVRQFTQDDAHIYCTPDQIESEVIGVMRLAIGIYKTFGMEDIHLELSTKPEKHIGSDEIWETSTNFLIKALDGQGRKYVINEGDGAFYGPKIDFHARDCLGRSWQLGTIQLDFSMPERFDLVYNDRDNTEKRPVMIHRAILGSMERFLGIVIENFAGAFPLWLSPEQARVMPISEKTRDYGHEVLKALQEVGLRCTIDDDDDKITAKIKRAHEQKAPYMLVVGPQECQEHSVTVRIRGRQEQKKLAVEEFITKAKDIISRRELVLDLG